MPETPAPHRDPAVIPHPGLVLAGRYELVHLLASGGMAEVWQAVDRVLERPVAVKLLHQHLLADASFTARFRAEAIAAARLRHPSIVAIFDTCHDPAYEAIVMELVRGRTLREELDERGRLSPREVVHIGAEVADALAVAHRAGIIHRDIKPANILLCEDHRVMVTDFGIAKVRDDTDLTDVGTMLGTVKYLSPEQVESAPVDPRSDLYSLGVVLYEALVGRPPFVAETAAATALVRLHQAAPAARTFRPDVPVGLDSLLERLLARRPDDRVATASDLRAMLLSRATLQATPVAARPETTVADATVIEPGATHRDDTMAVPVPGTGAGPADAVTDEPAPSGAARAVLLPLVILLLVGGSLALAVALVARTRAGDDLLDRVQQAAPDTAQPAVVRSVRAFDPQGDGQEGDATAALAVDRDPATAWRSETYQSATFGNLKQGIGLIAVLDRPASLRDLTLTSTTPGWTARVYVADRAGDTLADWGEPVTAATTGQSTTTIDLGGRRGSAVLIWFTSVGEAGRIEIGDLRVGT